MVDALKWIVYSDDSQVVLRTAAEIEIDVDDYELVSEEGDLVQYQKLAGFLAEEGDILYIEVGEISGIRLFVGGMT